MRDDLYTPAGNGSPLLEVFQQDIHDRKGKWNIFDLPIHMEYSCIMLIDMTNGYAADLFGFSAMTGIDTTNQFLYEPEIDRYLSRFCTDISPKSVEKELSLASVAECLSHSNVCRVQYSVRSVERPFARMKSTFYRMNPEGTVVCHLMQDISDVIKDEATQNEKLKSALDETRTSTESSSQFLALLGRDIRSPLQSILGLSHIACNELSDPQAIRDYLHKIRYSGRNIAETVDDILELSSIAESKRVMRPATVDLKENLNMICDSVREKMEAKSLSFDNRFQEFTHTNVYTDRYYLNQVFLKLLDFVARYTLRGGSIQLESRELSSDGESAVYEFSIAIHGIVFSMKQMEAMSRPQEYLIEELGKNINNADVSLIVLKSYLSALKGNLTVSSQDDTNVQMRVTIEMPLATVEPPSETVVYSIKHANAPTFRGSSVLLVDDDEIALEVVKKLLESREVFVSTATNGIEAVQAFSDAKGHFDLILMDIRMPWMDGLEAARQIRSMDLPGASTIPIIALTANTRPADAQLSLEAGMNEHLVKPIEPDVLYPILTQYLPVR